MTATDVASPEPAASAATTAPAPGPAADLAGADALRDRVADTTPTVANIVERLDSWGFTVADTRFSVWSVLVVIMVIVGVFLFARLGSKFANSGVRRLTRLDIAQRLLVEKLVAVVVWVVAIMIGIDLLGIDLTALTVFSGAFGLAVGFGLQKTFGNLIAGIILLMDRSIKPGDVIAVADTAGNETFGQIRKIGVRAVSIVTRDAKEYLIPNENLMINQVENWSYSSREVRVQVPVGVSYNCDLAQAEALMLQAARSCKRVLDHPPPAVWLLEFGDNSLKFVIHCWIVDPEEGVGNVRSDVLKKLWDLFHEHGIEIPFPQRDINLRANDEFNRLVAAIGQRLGNESTNG
jgi:small-conductance mechanosensitive channel